MKLVWGTRVQITILGDSEKNLDPSKRKIRFSSRKMRINAKKIWKIIKKTLKMDKHFLKDTHNPKLNILECDRKGSVKAFAPQLQALDEASS